MQHSRLRHIRFAVFLMLPLLVNACATGSGYTINGLRSALDPLHVPASTLLTEGAQDRRLKFLGPGATFYFTHRRVSATPAELTAFFANRLPEEGWRLEGQETIVPGSTTMFLWRKDDLLLTNTVIEHGQDAPFIIGGRTMTTYDMDVMVIAQPR